jgi:hypothetical protein
MICLSMKDIYIRNSTCLIVRKIELKQYFKQVDMESADGEHDQCGCDQCGCDQCGCDQCGCDQCAEFKEWLFERTGTHVKEELVSSIKLAASRTPKSADLEDKDDYKEIDGHIKYLLGKYPEFTVRSKPLHSLLSHSMVMLDLIKLVAGYEKNEVEFYYMLNKLKCTSVDFSRFVDDVINEVIILPCDGCPKAIFMSRSQYDFTINQFFDPNERRARLESTAAKGCIASKYGISKYMWNIAKRKANIPVERRFCGRCFPVFSEKLKVMKKLEALVESDEYKKYSCYIAGAKILPDNLFKECINAVNLRIYGGEDICGYLKYNNWLFIKDFTSVSRVINKIEHKNSLCTKGFLDKYIKIGRGEIKVPDIGLREACRKVIPAIMRYYDSCPTYSDISNSDDSDTSSYDSDY